MISTQEGPHWSAYASLKMEVQEMKEVIKKQEYEKHSIHPSGNHIRNNDKNIEFVERNDLQGKNPQKRHKDTKLDMVYVPKHKLMTINGWCNRKRFHILQEDGCSTSIVSKYFVRKNKHFL